MNIKNILSVTLVALLAGALAQSCAPQFPDPPAPEPTQPVDNRPIASYDSIGVVTAVTDEIPVGPEFGTRNYNVPVNSNIRFNFTVNAGAGNTIKSVKVEERIQQVLVFDPLNLLVLPIYRTLSYREDGFDSPTNDNFEVNFSSTGQVQIPGEATIVPFNYTILVVSITNDKDETSFIPINIKLLKYQELDNPNGNRTQPLGLYAEDTISVNAPTYIANTAIGSFFNSTLETVAPQIASIAATTDITYALLGDPAVPHFVSPSLRTDPNFLATFSPGIARPPIFEGGRVTVFQNLGPRSLLSFTEAEIFRLQFTPDNSSTTVVITPNTTYGYLNANGEKGVIRVSGFVEPNYPFQQVRFTGRALRYTGPAI